MLVLKVNIKYDLTVVDVWCPTNDAFNVTCDEEAMWNSQNHMVSKYMAKAMYLSWGYDPLTPLIASNFGQFYKCCPLVNQQKTGSWLGKRIFIYGFITLNCKFSIKKKKKSRQKFLDFVKDYIHSTLHRTE